jgi:ribosomal protein L40E
MFSAIKMDKEKTEYLINYFLYLLPLEVKSKLKYPYLRVDELEKEKAKLAEIILRDFPDKILFNNCPRCGKLARTPQAKQCRHCGYDWHNENL